MTKPVHVLGAGAHPWGKWPNRSQLQLAIDALGLAMTSIYKN